MNRNVRKKILLPLHWAGGFFYIYGFTSPHDDRKVEVIGWDSNTQLNGDNFFGNIRVIVLNLQIRKVALTENQSCSVKGKGDELDG